MGGDTSRPLPALPEGQEYMSIVSYDSDSLILYYVTQTEIETVRNAICSSWRKGIKGEEYLCEEDKKNPTHRNCLKFKLNGRPWGQKTGEVGFSTPPFTLICRIKAITLDDNFREGEIRVPVMMHPRRVAGKRVNYAHPDQIGRGPPCLGGFSVGFCRNSLN